MNGNQIGVVGSLFALVVAIVIASFLSGKAQGECDSDKRCDYVRSVIALCGLAVFAGVLACVNLWMLVGGSAS